MWTKENVHQAVIEQREFFLTNKTLDINFRKEQLKKLKRMVISHEHMEQTQSQNL